MKTNYGSQGRYLIIPAVGGASQWSETAEASAEEVAPSVEGEGPAAERAQQGRAGSQ